MGEVGIDGIGVQFLRLRIDATETAKLMAEKTIVGIVGVGGSADGEDRQCRDNCAEETALHRFHFPRAL